MEIWTIYFSVTSGSASGLTGLIFIGLSVNLGKILKITGTHRPGRIFGSMILLANILIISNLCLIPEQPISSLGMEIEISAVIIWIIVTRLDLIVYRGVGKMYKQNYFRNIFFSQLSIIPFLAGGLLLIVHNTNGFYVLVPGIVFSFIKSLVDAWFLLVEINR